VTLTVTVTMTQAVTVTVNVTVNVSRSRSRSRIIYYNTSYKKFDPACVTCGTHDGLS
jgi:hypothetical protein